MKWILLKSHKNKNGILSYQFSVDNYNAGVCGSGHTLTGDIQQGNSTFDSARANMGEPWVIFTKDQVEELIYGTTSEWITINKINGRKFINKKDTSKYVFLTAGGYWFNINYNERGSNGNYWSTISNTSDVVGGWILYFSSDDIVMSNNGRACGMSIRAVRPKPW